MVQPSPQPQTQLPTTDTDQSLLQQPEQPPVLEESPEPRIPQPQLVTSTTVYQPPSQGPRTEPVLRRSTRPRAETQRMNVGSWQGQSYDAASAASDIQLYGSGMLPYGWQYPLAPASMTAPSSVGPYYGLHHSVPGGGWGISGYGWSSSDVQSALQTKYWPGTGSRPLYTDWAKTGQPHPKFSGHSGW